MYSQEIGLKQPTNRELGWQSQHHLSKSNIPVEQLQRPEELPEALLNYIEKVIIQKLKQNLKGIFAEQIAEMEKRMDQKILKLK